MKQKDYETFSKKQQERLPRKSEIRFEIDELLRELDDIQQPFRLRDNLIMWLNGFVMAVQFIIWKWNEKPVGETYGFKVGNMYLTATMLLAIVFYVQARRDGGLRLLSRSKLLGLSISRSCVGFANVLQMTGLLFVGPEVAVALWFSKIFMIALAELLFKRMWPAKLVGSILVAGFLLTGLYVMYIDTSGPHLLGVSMILFAMLFYGFTVTFRSMIFSGYKGDEEESTPPSSTGFWLCVAQMPIFSFYIVLDGLFLTKPLTWTDFVPGYGYDWKNLILLTYLFAVFFVGKYVLSLGSHEYVITSYTGNFFSLLVIYLYYGLTEFNISRLLIICLLYVNSMTCELAKTDQENLKQKNQLVTRFKTVTEKSSQFLTCNSKKNLLREARKSRDMSNMLKETLSQLQEDVSMRVAISDLRDEEGLKSHAA